MAFSRKSVSVRVCPIAPEPTAVVPVVRLVPGTDRNVNEAVPVLGPVVAPSRPATRLAVPPTERYGLGSPDIDEIPPLWAADTAKACVTVLDVMSAVFTIGVVAESVAPTR